MACPHAKTIKGAVAYCSIIKKKVSTLKFPCKGDYRRCPIYVRAKPQVEAAQESKPVEPPKAEKREEAPKPVKHASQPAPVKAEEKSVEAREEETPKPASTAPTSKEPAKVKQESKPEKPPEKPVAKGSSRIAWQPGGALCDSMVIALLLVSSKSVGTYKGGYDGLEDMLKKMESNGVFYYIAGDVDNWRVRFTYANMKVFGLSVEKNGQLICGDEALKLIQPLEEKNFDVVIYSVSWDDLGPAAEKLRKSL